MAENYGTLEGTLDEHGVLSGEMNDRATLEGEIQFGSGGGGVLDVFQNGQSVVEGRYAYVTVPTFLKDLRSDDYHNTVTTLEIQNWNGKADTDDIPTALSQLDNDANYVQDADYVHTDNNFTDEDKAAIGGIPENITDLSDVAVDNIQNGQVLKWDATQEKFVNANESGGGGDVTDVKVDGTSVVDPVTGEADIDLSGKADKALDAVAGDFAVLLANGNYANSGKSANDMASKAEMSVNTSGTQTTVQLKNGTSATINNPTITIQKNGQNVDTFTLNQTANKVIDISVPTKTSDLQNDSSFITNTVDNLANYYLKSQTYTQTEVDALIDAAINGRFQKVNVLPATGEPNVIYLVPKATPETSNACDEYIWQDNAWELIGSTDIDLSGYVTDDELNTALADYLTTSAFNTAIANYYTKTEVGNLLDEKVDKVSGKGLSTYDYDATAKEIVDSVTTNLAGKVDKINGKGLSTEDYTTTEKNKLAGISTGANKVESSTTNGNIKIDGTETQVYDGSGKVDKVNGKDLSTNDYDNTDKAKVDMIDNTTTSATGNPISIADLKSAQIALNPVITFEPIQAGSGTPSPSNIRAISGYDKIEVLSCQRNIFNSDWLLQAQGWTKDSSGLYSGLNTALYAIFRVDTTNGFPVKFKPNTQYTFSLDGYTSTLNYYVSIVILYTDGTISDIVQVRATSLTHYTGTSAANKTIAKIGASFGAGANVSLKNIQVEEATAETTYEPYHKTTDLSESLGQTVYGGLLDVRTGKFTVTHKSVKLNTLSWTYYSQGLQFYSDISDKASGQSNVISSIYKTENSSADFVVIGHPSAGRVHIRDTQYNGNITNWLNATGDQTICYELADSAKFTIQLTPYEIALSQGYNYISTNGTSISLAYHNGEIATHADVEQLAETVNDGFDLLGGMIKSALYDSNQAYLLANATMSFDMANYKMVFFALNDSSNVAGIVCFTNTKVSGNVAKMEMIALPNTTISISGTVVTITKSAGYNGYYNMIMFK